MAKKVKLATKFNKFKTDEDKAKFILKTMTKDDFAYGCIWEEYGKKFSFGPIWDSVNVDKKVFLKIKPKLERHAEHETYSVHHFWVLKNKYTNFRDYA